MKNLRLLKVSILTFALCSGFAVTASAQEMFSFYSGVRQNAMGNAYTGIVNDETAILTNPAGLGKVRDATFTLFDPEISAGQEAGTVFDSKNYSKAMSFNTQSILTEANNKGSYGPIHIKAQIFPSLVLENFGIGLLYKQEHDSLVDLTGTNYTVRAVNDYALAMAYDFRFWGGIMKIGVGGKYIDRTEIDTVVPVATTNLDLNNYGAEGTGIAATTGLILTAPVALLPSISATLNDVGGTSFNLSDGMFHKVGARRPKYVPQRLDAGINLQPILGNHVRMTLTAEMHDLTNLSKHQDKIQLIHGGGELNFADFFFLRAGMNGRYYTGGGEFATERFQLQAATYGEEVGTYPEHREDRRYVVKFSLRY